MMQNVQHPNALLQKNVPGDSGGLGSMSPQGVQLQIQDRHVVIGNGILQVTLSNPGGIVTGIQYNGLDNVLEIQNEESNRGYWDVVWSALDGKAGIFEVFILLRGCSGVYTYAIYEHLGSMEWPAFSLGETRIAFKLRKDKFQYMAVADNRQRSMPLPDDRLPGRGQPLAYPEAVLLVNPVEPAFKGEVDDKYQYSCENRDLSVHGWISMDPPVGFWQITASNEFRSGGPLKQNLSSHVGPTCLAVFLSAHYAGDPLVPKFDMGEPWKKVFGPVFIYLNSVMNGDDPFTLWDDAKQQTLFEVQSWPYNFPASEDFPSSDQREIKLRLISAKKMKLIEAFVTAPPRYIDSDYIPAKGAYVGLAPPGDVGSWQTECKDYQFWTKADEDGYFSINNIRAGDYNLYAWVPGFVGDYRYDVSLTITPGCEIDTGDLVYEPPRNGPTLWEIGIPDRSAAEFYVPDPNPKYINKLFLNHPDRKKEDNTYQGTTWQIKFKLDNVCQTGTYKLRVALASATLAELQVRVNDPNRSRPLFSSGLIGRDNSIARHGIHGLYWLYNVDILGALLVQGDNSIYLTQPRSAGPFQGIMYDYLRLEAPDTLN
ncbi:hypothetical protein RJ640_001454 [Escallonia rubra]|uniref:rhamnogalacturonan endolyase n=1 Tax=Escallonia rubra TaxID=112253 RepID=A0AA88S382_9ASTE|nr:hypothetical protein RJ640_001454 [Escallonia rubra]